MLVDGVKNALLVPGVEGLHELAIFVKVEERHRLQAKQAARTEMPWSILAEWQAWEGTVQSAKPGCNDSSSPVLMLHARAHLYPQPVCDVRHFLRVVHDLAKWTGAMTLIIGEENVCSRVLRVDRGWSEHRIPLCTCKATARTAKLTLCLKNMTGTCSSPSARQIRLNPCSMYLQLPQAVLKKSTTMRIPRRAP